MAAKRSVILQIAAGVVAGAVAFALAHATHPSARVAGSVVLDAGGARFDIHSSGADLVVSSQDGSVSFDVELNIVIDGAARPLALRAFRSGIRGVSAGGTMQVATSDGSVDATVDMRVDRAHDALTVSLVGPPSLSEEGRNVSLSAELSSGGQVTFVAGVGQLADRANVIGRALLVGSEPHPLAVLSPGGPVAVEAVPEDAMMPVQPMRIAVTSPPLAAGGAPAALSVAVGASSAGIWRTLAEIAGVPFAHIGGHVTGAADRAVIFGRDAQGSPQVRAVAGQGGGFSLEVPTSVVQWYAAIDPGRASGVVTLVPGTPQELILDVAPGGDLHVSIFDADAHVPLTARLLVHGIDGTVDPNFGPDYRASGAGPVIDALRGELTTPLPSGRYRVAATKGIEWSIDAKIVDIAPGRVSDVELAPRHVVPTPGVLGCDLHVHARPSFDTPVTPEDRVVSLAAAGIDFAVPTEHNIVGDYASALETLDLGRELMSIPGVEITTYGKGFGHFGVFPFPVGAPVPPFKHTNMAAIFKAVRSGDSARYFQLNHPRLPKGIGYFNVIGFDPNAPRSQIRNRIDFDGIEIYNGYDSESPDRVDQVLRDYWSLLDFGWRYTATGSSDSHRIQFHWAGYPRTMVNVDPTATVDHDPAPSDPMAVVAAIKKGHAVVTTGPIIEMSLTGARPGDELATTEDPISGHLRIRAAPWIDVTRVDIVVGHVGGTWSIPQTFEVAKRPLQTGPEPGTAEEASDRTIRFDRDIEVSIGPENGWVQVVARGDRRMDDVLPFMPVPPLGFTNPVYVTRKPTAAPPFPGVGAPRAP
jgi:hypothetical protein